MRKIIPLLLLVAAIAAGWIWYRSEHQPQTLVWQGWVEGDFLFLGPDEAGRLVRLSVKEGDKVKEGTPLFAVQSDIQHAEMEQAEAALAEAKARLARAEAAQQRPEEVLVLEAQKARAEAAIEQSKPELVRAKDLVARDVAPQSRLDAAAAALARDEATLSEVERQIEVARLKSRTEDIEAAQAVVQQAKARVAAAAVSLDRRQLKAPADSVVQEVYYRKGEVVPAGRPVLSLLPPGNIKLRFYVPETELATLKPGMIVEAACDGCAEPIRGRVSFISTEAEFTPPVIFSREERKKLVFRVEARTEEGSDLRVGLPLTVKPASEDVQSANARK